MNSKFKLEIVSKSAEHKGRQLVQHEVDGRNHVGVFGDEPFAIRFRNTSNERVQVRLSLDGTDILTTEPASITTTGKMWMVEAYETLELEAWPETNEAGARFVFRDEAAGVALHTHGDLSQKGTIAAAVYTEKYRSRPYGTLYGSMNFECCSDVTYDSDSRGIDYSDITKGVILNDSAGVTRQRRSASVGAGETVKQAIGTAKGLTAPVLAEVVTLNYLWWDELKEKLALRKTAAQAPTGFKDYVREPVKMANLKSTPRLDRVAVLAPVVAPDYSRIY